MYFTNMEQIGNLWKLFNMRTDKPRSIFRIVQDVGCQNMSENGNKDVKLKLAVVRNIELVSLLQKTIN